MTIFDMKMDFIFFLLCVLKIAFITFLNNLTRKQINWPNNESMDPAIHLFYGQRCFVRCHLGIYGNRKSIANTIFFIFRLIGDRNNKCLLLKHTFTCRRTHCASQSFHKISNGIFDFIPFFVFLILFLIRHRYC